MLNKKIDIEKQIKYLATKGLNSKDIRKKLKTVMSRYSLPSLKVFKNTLKDSFQNYFN